MGDEVVETFDIAPQSHNRFHEPFPSRFQLLQGATSKGGIGVSLPEREEAGAPFGL